MFKNENLKNLQKIEAVQFFEKTKTFVEVLKEQVLGLQLNSKQVNTKNQPNSNNVFYKEVLDEFQNKIRLFDNKFLVINMALENRELANTNQQRLSELLHESKKYK